MATTITCSDCVTGEGNEKAHVGKAYKKQCSLAEQHSKLYLQSKWGSSCEAVRSHKALCPMGYQAVLYTETRQSSLQLQSKFKQAVQGKQKRSALYKKLGNRSKGGPHKNSKVLELSIHKREIAEVGNCKGSTFDTDSY